jgi:hypothetical protein
VTVWVLSLPEGCIHVTHPLAPHHYSQLSQSQWIIEITSKKHVLTFRDTHAQHCCSCHRWATQYQEDLKYLSWFDTKVAADPRSGPVAK